MSDRRVMVISGSSGESARSRRLVTPHILKTDTRKGTTPQLEEVVASLQPVQFGALAASDDAESGTEVVHDVHDDDGGRFRNSTSAQEVQVVVASNPGDAAVGVEYGGGIPARVTELDGSAVYSGASAVPAAHQQEDQGDSAVDDSYRYFDNLRGKIDASALQELVEKYGAEDRRLSKSDRLEQWTKVAEDYRLATGQVKSRTVLMKKWSSAKYYREHEGRPVRLGGRVKGRPPVVAHRGRFKEAPAGDDWLDGVQDLDGGRMFHSLQNLSSSRKQQLKRYDEMLLEARRFERDAQKVVWENAVIEGEKLRKESAVLDVELDIARVELAMRKEEALKMGIIVQTVEEAEDHGTEAHHHDHHQPDAGTFAGGGSDLADAQRQ